MHLIDSVAYRVHNVGAVYNVLVRLKWTLKTVNGPGPIPDELGDLSKLINLTLSDNGLDGSLPTALSKLTRLQVELASYSSVQNLRKLADCEHCLPSLWVPSRYLQAREIFFFSSSFISSR